MAVDTGDIVRITAQLLFDSVDDIQNVIHIESTGVMSVSDTLFMDDVATWLDDAYAGMVTRQDTRLTYDAIRGQNITQMILLPTKSWPTLTAGTSANEGLPLTVTAQIFFPTTVPRRIGKIYLPPMTENTQDTGVIDAATRLVLGTFSTDINTTVVGANSTFRYVVWSRKFLGFSVPTTEVVSTVYRTQRRRRQGVGS